MKTKPVDDHIDIPLPNRDDSSQKRLCLLNEKRFYFAQLMPDGMVREMIMWFKGLKSR
jgi:hypothetical protein